MVDYLVVIVVLPVIVMFWHICKYDAFPPCFLFLNLFSVYIPVWISNDICFFNLIVCVIEGIELTHKVSTGFDISRPDEQTQHAHEVPHTHMYMY
jgi:hypothetical protein